MKYLRPNAKRAKVAIILIQIILMLEIITLISGIFYYQMLKKVYVGYLISDETLDRSDMREGIIALFYIVAFIISIVTFIRWFRRAYFNLRLLDNSVSYKENWATLAWFIPILNLYVPYRIMRELYVHTRWLISGVDNNLQNNFSTGRISAWWTLWIIENIIGQIIYKISFKATNIDDLMIASAFGLVSNIIGIILAVITIRLIKDYSRMETVLSETNFEIKDTEQDKINLNKDLGE